MDSLRRRPLDDSTFVASAYRELFGRPADPRGFVEGRQRLRRGTLRDWMIRGWLNSDEALRHLGAQARAAALARLPGARALYAGTAALHCWRRLRHLFGTTRPVAPRQILVTRPPDLAERPAPLTRAISKRSKRAILTIAAANYLPQVNVLFASLAKQHPDCDHLWLLVGDDPVDTQALPGVHIVAAAAAGIDELADMSIRYDLLELSTAVKPFALRWLLSTVDYEQVVYLDPDIELFQPLDEVFGALETGVSAVVTPHLLQPLPPPGEPDDHTILRSGVFNLGFIAFSRSDETDSYLAWWSGWLRTHCRVEFENNLFTDQRWCDLLPCFVSRLLVLRHPGYNVAYWNIEQRPVDRGPDGWTAAGQPLVFFHFSGFDPLRPERFSRHQTRLSTAVIGATLPLLQSYATALRTAGWPTAAASAGLAPASLPPLLRRFYRDRFPATQPGAATALLQTLLQTALAADDSGLPALLRFLHQSRHDLREAFRLEHPWGSADLADWVADCALDELGLRPLAAARH